jgi:rubrerythrin
MRNIQKLVAVLALSGLCFAAGAPSESEPAAKKVKHAKAEVKKDKTADELRELKDVVDQQQAALQQLQQQLQKTQQQLQQTQSQLNQTQQQAQDAQAKAAAVENSSNMQVQKVQSDLSDVKTALNATSEAEKKTAKAVGELEHPDSIAFKGVRLTPGGYADFTGYWRQHALNSGPASTFNAIPLGNAYKGVGGLTEYGQTARGSRLTLRADADAGKTKLTGYFEGDFFGVAVANPNQTDAWPFRIRQAWGRAKFEDGWTITGGQEWNMMTMNRRAADSDAVWIPNVLDTNYIVGWNWGRQAEIKFAKTIPEGVTFAVSVNEPAALVNVNNTNAQVAGLTGSGSGNLGNTYATTCSTGNNAAGTPVTVCTLATTYTTNKAPDFLEKIAYDNPRWGHFEVKAVERFFRARINETTTNKSATGFGGGAGFIVPIIPKKLDFVGQGMYGKGISRYIDSGQYDLFVRQNTVTSIYNPTFTSTGGDDGLQPLKAGAGSLGLESHPTPRLELDLYGSFEHYDRSPYYVTTICPATAPTCVPTLEALGYGVENGANNRSLIEGTIAAWYDLIKGRQGTLRYGAQYYYAQRRLWSAGGEVAQHGLENAGYVGMRYILP